MKRERTHKKLSVYDTPATLQRERRERERSRFKKKRGER
jgi:hypothetical protein